MGSGTRTETATRRAAPRPHRHPIWRKAPGRLLHHPVSFAALAVGALLVVISTAAYPMFVSASQSELLAAGIHSSTVTRFGAGITYRNSTIRFDVETEDGTPLYEARGAAFARATSRSPALDPAITQILGDEVDVTLPGGRPPPSGAVAGRLFAGGGAIEHLQILSGTEGDGVWLPDLVADAAGVGPGDHVELHRHGEVVTVSVDGVYRGLYALPHVGYFHAFNDEFYTDCGDCAAPPQPIVMDESQLIDIAGRLESRSASFAWLAPVREDPPPTLQEARVLTRFSADLGRRMARESTPFGLLLPCCGEWVNPLGPPFFFSENALKTAMPQVVQSVEERSAASQAPIFVLSVAAVAIAMAVVAAAAAFSFAARRVEAGVLTARGWGPGAVAAKSTLESVAPVAIGAVLGFLAAAAMIAVAGPAGAVDTAARSRALRVSASATLVALVVVAIVSAASYVARHERRERLARWLLWIPWEVAAAWFAWTIYQNLAANGGLVESGGLLRPGAGVFLFPLALSLAVGIVAARLAVLVLMRRRPRRSGISGWFMAERRLASSPRLAALFLVAAAMSLSVFASAQAMASSLRATVDAKAGVFVGSDVQVRVSLYSEPDTEGYPFPVTRASRVRDAGAITGSETHFDLVAVDPATLEGAAFWDPAFADEPLADLLDRLHRAPGAPLPILLSNGGGRSFDAIDLGVRSVPVEIVGTTSSFPGTSSQERPLVVIDRRELEADGAAAGAPNPLNVAQGGTELWIRGPAPEVLPTVDDLGVLPLSVLTADEVKDIPYIDAAIDTFVMLNVLGIAALVLVLVVAVVYVQARQRARLLGAALSARMGMTSAMLRRSLVAELAAVLGVAVAIGGLVGLVSVAVVVPTLDPLPTVPPDPLILRPWAALLAAGLVLVVAAILGGSLATRATERTSLAEVMRAAE